MKSEVASMARHLNDGTRSSPEQVLNECLGYIGEKGAFKDGKRLIVLALDKGPDGDDYMVNFSQAGMTMSECVALCEVAKSIFLSEMNY